MSSKKVNVIFFDEPLVLTEAHQVGEKFMLFISPTNYLFLTLCEGRRLFDEEGNEYGIADETLMLDTEERTGIWPFVLPKGHWSEIAAKPHDFVTSCKIYELSNPRSRAEAEFKRRLDSVSNTRGRRFVTTILTSITGALSGVLAWDVKETRNE